MCLPNKVESEKLKNHEYDYRQSWMRKKLDIGCEFLWKKTRQIARQKCTHVTSTATYTSVTRTLPKWCSNRAKYNQSRQRILLKFWWESFYFTVCVVIRHLLVLCKPRLVLSLDSGHPTQLFKLEAGSRSIVGLGYSRPNLLTVFSMNAC